VGLGVPRSAAALGGLEIPEHHVLALGEMKNRIAGELQPIRRGHRVELDRPIRLLKRPGRMVNVGPVDPAALGQRVEAVALREEARERIVLREPPAARGLGDRELGRLAVLRDPLAPEGKAVIFGVE
jgi:hypothetical protein